jgi:hypothetical protein
LPASACTDGWQQYTDPTGLRDFYTFTVPNDPRLPNGGGYTILGLNNQKVSGALPGGSGGVVLIRDDLGYTWAGVDTNVVMRARGGLRLSGGTSTGRSNRNTCATNIDSPNVQGRTGAELLRGCIQREPMLTNIRGNVSYTIPWIDVLASGVFRYQPGPEISALMTVQYTDVVWEPESANRQGLPFTTGTSGGSSNTANIQLLNNRDMYGEGMRMFDLTLRKNVRFLGKRLSAGLDIYNIFNSDAPLAYQSTYTATRLSDGTWVQGNPTTGALNDWRRITSITSPRFARFNLTFDF